MSTRTKWLVDHLSYLSYLPHFTSAARRPSSCRRLSLCPLDRSMSRRRAADDNGLPGTLHGLKAIAGPPRHMLDALRLHQLFQRFIIARSGKIVRKIPRSRSEEHTSELQSLMRHSYAVLCLKNNKQKI